MLYVSGIRARLDFCKVLSESERIREALANKLELMLKLRSLLEALLRIKPHKTKGLLCFRVDMV